MKKVASQDPQPTAEVGNVITRADTALYRLHLGGLTGLLWKGELLVVDKNKNTDLILLQPL